MMKGTPKNVHFEGIANELEWCQRGVMQQLEESTMLWMAFRGMGSHRAAYLCRA